MTEGKLTFTDWILYKNAMLLYDKSNVFNISFDGKMATGVGKVNIIRLHDDQVQLIDNNVIVWTEFGNCKLILRNISQLTDDEKIYINDNLFYGLFKNTVSLNANAIWNSFDELLAVCEDKTALIDYLRGNNILIEPEDWFKSGKAVKDDK